MADLTHICASMRPRPFERGNALAHIGSASMPPSFNEAAPFRARKPRTPYGVSGAWMLLQ